jgi:hypothetical protein
MPRRAACVAQASWADGPGREEIERLYGSSAGLSGDAVVIFVRALCAVSQEELVPANMQEPARWACCPKLIWGWEDTLVVAP